MRNIFLCTWSFCKRKLDFYKGVSVSKSEFSRILHVSNLSFSTSRPTGEKDVAELHINISGSLGLIPDDMSDEGSIRSISTWMADLPPFNLKGGKSVFQTKNNITRNFSYRSLKIIFPLFCKISVVAIFKHLLRRGLNSLVPFDTVMQISSTFSVMFHELPLPINLSKQQIQSPNQL